MHDTILLSKISDAVKQLCKENGINKVSKLTVIVNHKSHVNEKNLYEHLQEFNGDLVGECTELEVQREDIQDQTAILYSIQGEESEK